jgi:hypothetical protein
MTNMYTCRKPTRYNEGGASSDNDTPVQNSHKRKAEGPHSEKQVPAPPAPKPRKVQQQQQREQITPSESRRELFTPPRLDAPDAPEYNGSCLQQFQNYANIGSLRQRQPETLGQSQSDMRMQPETPGQSQSDMRSPGGNNTNEVTLASVFQEGTAPFNQVHDVTVMLF